ncbi:MAG: NYN domain-containing protein [Candidatus Absconditabacterales bacterium]|nr:NYN domain-containing protein [Candidatus Absconditabacterales bacterium]
MEENFVFIDTQNVNLAIKDQGRNLDWKKFRIYLKDKYKAKKVYLFIGYIPGNQSMYSFFQDIGYHLVFKPVMELKSGKTKGNVDAELVLQAMIDYKKYNKAVLVTGDGDFACLVKHLQKENKFLKLIVPNHKKYSIFLKQSAGGKIDSITNLKNKLKFSKQKKGPPIKH